MADHNHHDHHEEAKKLHIAMFPWLAFGHMIPFLELSKILAQKGHTISFISTSRNIDRLPKPSPTLSPFFHFVSLTLPHGENLPEGAESTIDVPIKMVPYLKLAYDQLQNPVANFLETSHPDWILYDFSPYWLPEIARRLGVAHGYFSAFTAASLGVIVKPPGFEEDRKSIEDFMSPPKWVSFPTNVAFHRFEIQKIFDSFVEEQHGNVPDLYRCEKVLEGCDMIAVRSSVELEQEWLDLLEKLYQKPVVPLGPLPPVVYDAMEEERDETWRSIKGWLDKQAKGSIVYVAFGTEAKPSQDELTEIALGLELSGLPFFWALKTRRGANDPEPVELPEGFEERTKARGMVWKSWVPQPRVLSHESVGALLTHPGWGTVVEAIAFGRPMVMLTFLYDQGLNARVFEEKKIAYPVPRDERDGSFTKEAVAQSLRLVLVADEGEVYREKVKEMKDVFGDMNRQEKYINSFLNHLITHKNVRY